jgi:hypothetical protein
VEERATSVSARAVSWGAFGAGYLACYFLSTALDLPVLWYFPTEHRFELGPNPEGLAADFYGRVGLCLAAGLLAYVAVRLVVRRLSSGAVSRWILPVGVWGTALFLFTAALYGYKLHGRRSRPAPLPPNYVAR